MPEYRTGEPADRSLIVHLSVAELLIAAGTFVGLRRMSESNLGFILPLTPGIGVLTWWALRANARTDWPRWLRSRYVAALLTLPALLLGGLLATWAE